MPSTSMIIVTKNRNEWLYNPRTKLWNSTEGHTPGFCMFSKLDTKDYQFYHGRIFHNIPDDVIQYELGYNNDGIVDIYDHGEALSDRVYGTILTPKDVVLPRQIPERELYYGIPESDYVFGKLVIPALDAEALYTDHLEFIPADPNKIVGILYMADASKIPFQNSVTMIEVDNTSSITEYNKAIIEKSDRNYNLLYSGYYYKNFYPLDDLDLNRTLTISGDKIRESINAPFNKTYANLYIYEAFKRKIEEEEGCESLLISNLIRMLNDFKIIENKKHDEIQLLNVLNDIQYVCSELNMQSKILAIRVDESKSYEKRFSGDVYTIDHNKEVDTNDLATILMNPNSGYDIIYVSGVYKDMQTDTLTFRLVKTNTSITTKNEIQTSNYKNEDSILRVAIILIDTYDITRY